VTSFPNASLTVTRLFAINTTPRSLNSHKHKYNKMLQDLNYYSDEQNYTAEQPSGSNFLTEIFSNHNQTNSYQTYDQINFYQTYDQTNSYQIYDQINSYPIYDRINSYQTYDKINSYSTYAQTNLYLYPVI
jgi:hypothetical protein